MPASNVAIETKLERLRSSLLEMREVLVAFSGGVDSSFLVRVAHDTLGRGARALTTVSPTNPDEDTDAALALARELGVEHIVLYTNELEIPSYRPDRMARTVLLVASVDRGQETMARIERMAAVRG